MDGGLRDRAQLRKRQPVSTRPISAFRPSACRSSAVSCSSISIRYAKPMNEWAPGMEEQIQKWFPDVGRVVTAKPEGFRHQGELEGRGRECDRGIPLPELRPLPPRSFATSSTWMAPSLRCMTIGSPSSRRRAKTNRASTRSPPDGKGGQTDHFITLYMWPDWIIYSWPYANMISTFLMRPTGPETCVVENPYFDIPGESDDVTTRGSETWFNNNLGPEDAALNEGVQRGIKLARLLPGPLRHQTRRTRRQRTLRPRVPDLGQGRAAGIAANACRVRHRPTTLVTLCHGALHQVLSASCVCRRRPLGFCRMAAMAWSDCFCCGVLHRVVFGHVFVQTVCDAGSSQGRSRSAAPQ